MSDNLLHRETTQKVLKAFFQVYNTLGYGFLEKVYENGLAISLRGMGCHVQQQTPIKVYYEGHLVGDYFADLIVDGCVILELKAADTIAPEHEAQLLNYLKATDIEVGMVLNFGPEPKFVRKAFTNARKKSLAQSA